MMKNVKLITLDIVGTVIRFQEPPVARYVEVASQNGIKTCYQDVQKSFYKTWKEVEERHPHFGSTTNISSMYWWITVVKETFKDTLKDEYDDKKVQKIAAQLYSYYHSPKPYIVLDDSLEALHRLKKDYSHCKVGVISNFDNRLHDVLPSLGLKPYLDFIVTSEDARSSKPEAAIFDFAVKRANTTDLLPNQVLHVGDDMDKDYFGALNVGWNSLLVDRHGGGYTLVDEEHIINDLMQIFEK